MGGADVPEPEFRGYQGERLALDPATSCSNEPRDSVRALVAKNVV